MPKQKTLFQIERGNGEDEDAPAARIRLSGAIERRDQVFATVEFESSLPLKRMKMRVGDIITFAGIDFIISLRRPGTDQLFLANPLQTPTLIERIRLQRYLRRGFVDFERENHSGVTGRRKIVQR